VRLDWWWIGGRGWPGGESLGKRASVRQRYQSSVDGGVQAGRQAAGSGSLSRAARLRRATAVSVRVCDANAGAAER